MCSTPNPTAMFSFKRLSTQFRVLLGQYATRHGVALLAMLLYFTFTHFRFVPNLVLNDNNPFNNFFNLATIAAIALSLDLFRVLRSRTAGIYYQMTPATVTEKWLAALLYSTVFSLAVCFVAFWLVHALIITGANLFSPVDYAYQFPEWFNAWDNLKSLLFFQSLFFVGAVVFKKSPFLKTLLVIAGTLVLFSLVMGLVIKHQMQVTSISMTFDSQKGIRGFEYLDQFETLVKTLSVLSWVLPFGCWAGAWYRLKTIQH